MVAHVGAELGQTGAFLPIGRAGAARLIAGLDVKSTQQQGWRPGWSARAGIEFSRPRDANDPGRRWRILGEYYHGPSPYGQFFLEKTEYYGVGLHFTL